ncbi:hypothetical protein [Methanofollis fontis]|uniref:Uncharacterized protein n=1 Tax=Methanofollis fontis TaxID=2052832 RepID=A0A483CPQ8_9EURY|nr:hypothetical protein [Methanofollis fontis]TAJ44675.1 hypothetical protein CUJ86_05050 [Methanofollis fontis]
MRAASIAAGLVGTAASLLGLAGMLVWAGGAGPLDLGLIEIGGDDAFRWAWGGLVVLLGGVFMLGGARSPADLDRTATALLGAAMIGLVGGCDLFGMICTGIPAVFSPDTDVTAIFMPPYTPAVLLLPFVIASAYLLLEERRED